MALLAFGALVVVFLLWAIGAYNGLIKLRNMYRNAFAQIDVQLKRRHDLIPNLVETAKSFMKHERETLEAVIQARNAAASARDGLNPDDAAQMQGLMAAEAAGELCAAHVLGGTLPSYASAFAPARYADPAYPLEELVSRGGGSI